MKKLIVTKKYNNKKLSNFVLSNLTCISSNLFYKTLRKKDIKVNGKRTNKDIIIFENDEILIYIDDKILEHQSKLNIIYEDQNILIVNKPIGIEVTGNESLTKIIHSKYTNCGFLPMPCHRLDRNTKGLVLFAKNQESLNILLDKFKKHEIEKHYLALVYGIPYPPSQKLIAYLFKDSSKSLVYISDTPKKGYSKIITSYYIVEKYSNNTSLLNVEIETGKTHQIRAHLSHIGYPIVGDGKYGINSVNKKFGKNYQELTSFSLKFNFKSDSGFLNYLNNKEFKLAL